MYLDASQGIQTFLAKCVIETKLAYLVLNFIDECLYFRCQDIDFGKRHLHQCRSAVDSNRCPVALHRVPNRGTVELMQPHHCLCTFAPGQNRVRQEGCYKRESTSYPKITHIFHGEHNFVSPG
ncbi:unnamed protein product [Phytomonas sp. Hart1]|nr:unnamed protein product [Phytomonas sp. Hart1]|eukprot:CCW70647.1 unnamed protein product [Phytomonas sp. isolate Hart1]